MNSVGQSIQSYEALRIHLVVYGVLAEGGVFLTVERIRARHSRADDIALIELELDRAGHLLLCLIHEGGECLPQGREPQAIIDQLRIGDGKFFLLVRCEFIKANRFQILMCGIQDGTAGSFINAAAFDADQPVFHNI